MKYMKAAWVVLILLFAIGAVGFIVYDINNSDVVTVIVDIEDQADPYQTLPRTSLTDQIVGVRQVDAASNTYEVRVRTTRSRRSLLEWLRGKDRVESAVLEED